MLVINYKRIVMKILKKCEQYVRWAIRLPIIIKRLYDRNVSSTVSHNLYCLISAQMVLHRDKPEVIAELGRSFNQVGMIYNTKNALSYLHLVNPVRSPSLKLTRIGGQADGGYVLLCPPPFIVPLNLFRSACLCLLLLI